MKKKLVIIDEETGEILGDYKPKVKRSERSRFIKAHYVKLEEICRIAGLKEYPLIFRLAAIMDAKNMVNLDQHNKSRVMGFAVPMSRPTFYRDMKRIIAAGLIVPAGEDKYMINPFAFGRTQSDQREINETVWNKLLSLHFVDRSKVTRPKRRKKQQTTEQPADKANIFSLSEVN